MDSSSPLPEPRQMLVQVGILAIGEKFFVIDLASGITSHTLDQVCQTQSGTVFARSGNMLFHWTDCYIMNRTGFLYLQDELAHLRDRTQRLLNALHAATAELSAHQPNGDPV